jgi:uncharacterized protein (UPF0335 family)
MAAEPGNVNNDVIAEISNSMRAIDQRQFELNGERRAVVKQAKTAGINVKELRAALAIKRRDRDEVMADWRDRLRYMGILGVSCRQDELFGDLDFTVTEQSQRSIDMWDVTETAFKAGRYGQKIDDNPHNAGTEEHAMWRKWWTKGKEAMAKELGPDAKIGAVPRPRQTRIPGTEARMRAPVETNGEAPPKRRGRPPGTGKKKAAGRVGRRSSPTIATENGAVVY